MPFIAADAIMAPMQEPARFSTSSDSPTPALPALHASHAGIWRRKACDSETRVLTKGEAVAAARAQPHLLLGAPLLANRLGWADVSGLDLLELFAFVYPARFMVPTPAGLAQALGLSPPERDGDVPEFLQRATATMMAQVEQADWPARDGAWMALTSLERLGWSWAPELLARVARPDRASPWLFSSLPEWDEAGERAQPAQIHLDEAEVLARLDDLTAHGSEKRAGQRAYAVHAAQVFAPRAAPGHPHLLLSEAGTGTGKTLGYLAPTSLYTKATGGTVWVSTFTKALQRQLRRESRRVWPDPTHDTGDSESARGRKRLSEHQAVVVRKGRENYLCLLNLEDALQGGFNGRPAIFAQLVARWARWSDDGDMIGGDLPGWLATLFAPRALSALTDRRGECIYAGCPHFRKCFIERAARASASAELVIANHALVMVQAARGGELAARPTRLIFDEGHHVFAAADGTFAVALSGSEAIELRRWLLGPEKTARGRRRGLAARLADVASYDTEADKAISDALAAAEALPADGWLKRLEEATPWGPIEALLAEVRQLVIARDESGAEGGYGLETDITALDAPLIESGVIAVKALGRLRHALARLAARLEAILADPPDWLDGFDADRSARARLETSGRTLQRRIETIAAWQALLERIGGTEDSRFVDWLAVERIMGREIDVAMHRRWLDPMKPFAECVLASAHGVMITSATLRDGHVSKHDSSTDYHENNDWKSALERSGAEHLALVPLVASFPSPFDFARQAEVLIVTDVPKGDLSALAAAYARLIETAQGGVLGLFTAIRRLRAVHERIADRLARAGLPLHAQHIDPLDTGTLVDIFRNDPHASLFGTDALRDGVDVPGHSLRLVVMEQVPWPQPSILHRARRMANPEGAQAHDDRIVRARLAQGFGRLIRATGDRGHFVVLSPAFPSRLLNAFPAETPIYRLRLDEALQRIGAGVFDVPEAVPARSLHQT